MLNFLFLPHELEEPFVLNTRACLIIRFLFEFASDSIRQTQQKISTISETAMLSYFCLIN